MNESSLALYIHDQIHAWRGGEVRSGVRVERRRGSRGGAAGVRHEFVQRGFAGVASFAGVGREGILVGVGRGRRFHWGRVWSRFAEVRHGRGFPGVGRCRGFAGVY